MFFYSGQFDKIEFREPSATRKIPTLFEKIFERIIKNELKRNCKFFFYYICIWFVFFSPVLEAGTLFPGSFFNVAESFVT
jgi:hypothetical protein